MGWVGKVLCIGQSSKKLLSMDSFPYTHLPYFPRMSGEAESTNNCVYFPPVCPEFTQTLHAGRLIQFHLVMTDPLVRFGLEISLLCNSVWRSNTGVISNCNLHGWKKKECVAHCNGTEMRRGRGPFLLSLIASAAPSTPPFCTTPRRRNQHCPWKN